MQRARDPGAPARAGGGGDPVPHGRRGPPHGGGALLAAVRADGFAVSTGGNHLGLRGVAVPVPTADRRGAASVAVSGPADRWTAKRATAFAEVTVDRCPRLSLLFDTTKAPGTA
ncbi:IclR family transcriptional regulator C-terminal domain-containing protein [Streptomyces sp. NPDC101165]|uniref:IclR family transcriptional regulator domain-containing protein n=1 Tax=Streptomyces sp. NPDC101165 TaxID=3366119 RepID=UPI003825F5B1